MIKKINVLLSLFLVLCLSGSVYAGSKKTSVLPFLEMPVGARYIGMGGAGTAIADDSSAMFWNTGLMAKASESAVDFMHAVYVEDTALDYASAMYKINDKNAIGLSVQYFFYGDIDLFDHNGNAEGSKSSYDAAVSLGYSRDIAGFGVGIAAKFIKSELVSDASTFAFDFGIASPGMIDERLTFGLSVTNAGGGIKYNNETEDLPMTIRIGAGFYILDNLLAAADVGMPYEQDIYAAFGAEYSLNINEVMMAFFRAGYNTVSDSGDLSGLTAGMGFNYKAVIVDYAFVPMGNLGDTHRISLTYFW